MSGYVVVFQSLFCSILCIFSALHKMPARTHCKKAVCPYVTNNAFWHPHLAVDILAVVGSHAPIWKNSSWLQPREVWYGIHLWKSCCRIDQLNNIHVPVTYEAVLICNTFLFVGHDVGVSDIDDVGYWNCVLLTAHVCRCVHCAVYVRRLRQTVFTWLQPAHTCTHSYWWQAVCLSVWRLHQEVCTVDQPQVAHFDACKTQVCHWQGMCSNALSHRSCKFIYFWTFNLGRKLVCIKPTWAYQWQKSKRPMRHWTMTSKTSEY